MYNIEFIKSLYKGELHSSFTHRILYATDASVYREIPLAVAYPKTEEEILKLIEAANTYKIPLIARGAGTSLAGQVVGKGIIVDFSKYFNKIIEINTEKQFVRVQPGVVLDELNKHLKPYGFFFAPETSTSNRCTIGGMIGNNSCGARSLIYHSTREHILELKGFLSDGTYIHIEPLNSLQYQKKLQFENKEGHIYRKIHNILSSPKNLKIIEQNYPDSRLHRRNMGYALDILAKLQPFNINSNEPFNLSKIIAGSEGTLMIITEAKLKLTQLPPDCVGLVCIHLDDFLQTFDANLIALEHNPSSVELIDNIIIQLARTNKEQQENSFFVRGNPKTILIVEFMAETYDEIHKKAQSLIKHLQKNNIGYAFPVITGKDIAKIWNLRKSGLGVLSNMEGERKPLTVIEDTAVHPEFLKDFAKDMIKLLNRYGLECVFYAHIGSGEIHLKPALNLKSNSDKKLFRIIAEETVKIVKKYHGSVSGEHGDGRLRSEFIPKMLGNEIYQWLKEIKHTFDHNNIFNPGKIVDAVKMDENLRFYDGYQEYIKSSWFNYLPDKNWLSAVEKCNGSADCRKSAIIGGNMCPTYMATNDEKQTTRARANMLREVLSNSKHPFNEKELKEILDWCLSCKACKAECPSNIDMAKYKAEFLQNFYDNNSIPLQTKIIASIPTFYKWLSLFPNVSNFLINKSYCSKIIKKILNFEPKRTLPKLYNTTLNKFSKKYKPIESHKEIFLYNDEFTNFLDSHIGIKTIVLLEKFGYSVKVLPYMPSGRTYISKGMLKKAKKIAEKNLNRLIKLCSTQSFIVGIEPSAILSYRDEYPELVSESYKKIAKQLSQQIYTVEEFILNEFKKGNINNQMFNAKKKDIYVHIHCQYKAIAKKQTIIDCLKIVPLFNVHEIESTCCGMAGSFGYEKKHYELSMKIGELFLFKTLRQLPDNITIVANGTSCRQQILDGTNRKALHPVEVLFEAITH